MNKESVGVSMFLTAAVDIAKHLNNHFISYFFVICTSVAFTLKSVLMLLFYFSKVSCLSHSA